MDTPDTAIAKLVDHHLHRHHDDATVCIVRTLAEFLPFDRYDRRTAEAMAVEILRRAVEQQNALATDRPADEEPVTRPMSCTEAEQDPLDPVAVAMLAHQLEPSTRDLLATTEGPAPDDRVRFVAVENALSRVRLARRVMRTWED